MFNLMNCKREYDLKCLISECNNGNAPVYLAIHKNPQATNCKMVLVCVKKYSMINEKRNLVLNEILTMRSLSHPNLQTIITSFVDEMDVFVVCPLMTYGSAKLQITNKFVTGLPEIIVALILKDILAGLEYLHKKGYIHRSIRASHILLDSHKAILSGFRECTNLISNGTIVKELYDLPESVKGLNWLAPEVLEQNILGYSKASDIYSIGITICELGNGIEPYVDMSTTFMFTEKIRGNTQPLLLDYSTCPSEEITDTGVPDQTRQIYSQRKLSDGFHKIVEICLSKNPSDRPNISQLLNHSFLKQCKHTASFNEQFQSLDGLVNLIDQQDNIAAEQDFGTINHESKFEWDF